MSIMRFGFLLILLLIFVDSCLPTYKNNITIKTNSTEKEVTDTIHIRNLYVVASGDMSSRIVATNLHSALEKIMKKNGSATDFEFKNKPIYNRKQTLDEINSNLYDGYMLLSIRQSASINYDQQKYIYAVPAQRGSSVVGSGYGSAYQNTFVVEIFSSKKELIYDGEINFHFDPAKDNLYMTTANRLVKEISKYNILLW